MIFKNRRGDVPWYVVALVLAVVVLLISIGAVWKLRNAQNETGKQYEGACTTIAGGTCATPEQNGNCPAGQIKVLAPCGKDPSGNDLVCCKPSDAGAAPSS